MSGVWVFRNGVVKLVENPSSSSSSAPIGRRKALLHIPSGEVVSSQASLELKLAALGWERYYGGCCDGGGGMLLRYHKRSAGVDLISFPKDFNHFTSVHMYDIVVKNRHAFRVIDVLP